MARIKRQLKKPEKKRIARVGPSPFVRLLKRIPPQPLIKVALFLAIIAVTGYGLSFIDSSVKQVDIFTLQHIELEYPAWCPPQLAEHIRSLTRGFPLATIYNDKIVPAIESTYSRDPWVRRVISVRKQFPDKVIVRLDIRKPEFFVEQGGRRFLIDRDGYLLPSEYALWSPQIDRLQFIRSVRTSPPGAGRLWHDRALLAGIETLAYIADHGRVANAITIQGADVSNFGGIRNRNESEIVLIAANENRILWGRHPSTDRFGEPSPARKLEHLERLLNQNPQPSRMDFPLQFADVGAGAFRRDTN